ncbi:MAG: amidohydrolase [Gammaproteobacteria bacterium]
MISIRYATFFFVAMLGLSVTGESVAQDAGLLLTNGNIITLDEDNPVVDSVFVRHGRIAVVGNGLEAPAGAEVIDLDGRTMIPGLIDSHLHFIRAAQRPGYDMREVEAVRSIPEFQSALRRKATEIPPGELITVVTGWGPIQLAENRLPTSAEMNEALPNNPVYVHYRAYGPSVTNDLGAALFESGGIAVGGDRVFDEGEEAISAYYYLRGGQTLEQKARNTRLLMDYVSGLGITTVIDTAGTNRRGAQILEPAYDYDPILTVWRRGDMTVRMRPMFMSWDLDVRDGTGQSEVEERVRNSFMGFGDDMFRIAGLGEHTVNDSMSEQFYFSTALAARRGWLLQEHSASREENEYHIQAFEAANEIAPIADLHWSLTHVNEIEQDTLDRLIALGAGVTVQNSRFFSAEPGGGPPFRRIVDSGIQVGGGSDATVSHGMNPWDSLYYMVTGKNVRGDVVNGDQTITRLEALKLYTIGSAWFSHDENDLGTIEVGKHADLVVLSDDYLTVPEDEILDLYSVLTVLGGEIVHSNSTFYSQ